jgi:hypothetical protein
MNGMVKKVAVGVSVVVFSALILWLASHASRAESFMATTPIEISNQQEQLDRIEAKVDWLVQWELDQLKQAAE